MTELPAKRPRVLLIGGLDQAGSGHGQFARVIRWLGCQAKVTQVSSVTEAIQCYASSDPSLVLVLHTVPGLVPVNAEAQLEAMFSDCEIAHLLGPWCEGEMRGLRPMPGKQVIRWHQWQSGLESCLGPRADTEHSSAKVVRTVSGLSVGIATADLEMAECWASAIESIGMHAVVLSRRDVGIPASVSLVIWDEAKAARSAAIGLRTLVQEVAPVPVVAAIGFVRPSDEDAVREAGAVGILAKPFRVSDLSQLIYRHIPGSLPETRAGVPAA